MRPDARRGKTRPNRYSKCTASCKARQSLPSIPQGKEDNGRVSNLGQSRVVFRYTALEHASQSKPLSGTRERVCTPGLHERAWAAFPPLPLRVRPYPSAGRTTQMAGCPSWVRPAGKRAGRTEGHRYRRWLLQNGTARHVCRRAVKFGPPTHPGEVCGCLPALSFGRCMDG